LTTTGRTPWSGFSKLKRRSTEQVAAQIAEDGGEPMAPWTMHDLRRSLVTGMNDRGLAPPHIIEAIVNHISGHRGGIAGIYNKASTWTSGAGRLRPGRSSSPGPWHRDSACRKRGLSRAQWGVLKGNRRSRAERRRRAKLQRWYALQSRGLMVTAAESRRLTADLKPT
jgi:hypothetical protein